MSSPLAHSPVVVAAARRYRPELQGLRALAAVLVVVYHVWFDRISGGVDVFFLISGFLITGGLARAAAAGPIRFGRTWARQAVRLLPSAAVVLVATVVAGMAILPEGRWMQTVREIVSSAFFLENWRLAADSVDYSASRNTASVVQHFWSLSIQAQFYVVWPLLVAAVVLVAGRAGLHRSLTRVLLGVFAASLAYSVYLTAADQPLAYFDSLTRVWEFALGGLLALLADRVVLATWVRIVLGWLGVAGLVACGAVLQVGSVFPGYAALWPTLSAAAVIAAGSTGSSRGADRLLASAVMRRVGDLSYPLYLWHWPVLLFFLVLSGRGNAGLEGGLLVVAISLVLAALTHHLVEEPLRLTLVSPRAQLRAAVLALVVVLAAAGVWHATTTVRAAATAAAGDADHPGARATLPGFVYRGAEHAELLPPMVSVGDDWSQNTGTWTCGPDPEHPPVQTCASATDGPPDRRIVVAGDSHAQQLIAALLPVAAQRGWQIVSVVKGACPLSTASEVDPADTECLDWNTAAIPAIAALHPDAVITLASRDVRVGRTEQTPAGFVEAWQRLDDAGLRVVAFRDNPRFDSRRPDCVQQHGRGAAGCGVERDAVYSDVAPYTAAPGVPANVSFVDLSDVLCPGGQCPSEIGNVLVYLDDNHLSATFVATMAPAVEQRLDVALGW